MRGRWSVHAAKGTSTQVPVSLGDRYWCEGHPGFCGWGGGGLGEAGGYQGINLPDERNAGVVLLVLVCADRGRSRNGGVVRREVVNKFAESLVEKSLTSLS